MIDYTPARLSIVLLVLFFAALRIYWPELLTAEGQARRVRALGFGRATCAMAG
jgi:cobalamin biosynthesis protein CobD/CbiB